LEPSWSPDGRTIAFARVNPKSYQSGIWLVRPDGSRLRRILIGVKNATDPVWSPDGTHLLVEDGRTLYRVRPDGSGLRRIAQLSGDARGAIEDPQPAWSPDGRSIVFCQMRVGALGRSDLWTVRSDGTGLRRLTRAPELDRDPTWGP
jgi:TolB protein